MQPPQNINTTFTLDAKLAQEICQLENHVNPKMWFASELHDLASRFGGLDADDMPLHAINVLAHLVAVGPSDERGIRLSILMEPPDVQDCLDALHMYRFVEECPAGYAATEKGKEAFRAFSRKLVIRQLFHLKPHVKKLESLLAELRASD